MTSGLAIGVPAKIDERAKIAGEGAAAATGAKESAATGTTEEAGDLPAH